MNEGEHRVENSGNNNTNKENEPPLVMLTDNALSRAELHWWWSVVAHNFFY